MLSSDLRRLAPRPTSHVSLDDLDKQPSKTDRALRTEETYRIPINDKGENYFADELRCTRRRVPLVRPALCVCKIRGRQGDAAFHIPGYVYTRRHGRCCQTAVVATSVHWAQVQDFLWTFRNMEYLYNARSKPQQRNCFRVTETGGNNQSL